MIEALADVMVAKGVPEHIPSDTSPEFVAKDCLRSVDPLSLYRVTDLAEINSDK